MGSLSSEDWWGAKYVLEVPGEDPVEETGISDAMKKYNELKDSYGEDAISITRDGEPMEGHRLWENYRFFSLHVRKLRKS